MSSRLFRSASIALILLLLPPSLLLAGLRPYDLECDGMQDPLGIDSAQPRLSWKLDAGGERGAVQKAWQVLVSSTPELLSRDQGDLWDSGHRDGAEQLAIPYAGKPLHSAQQVFWKLRAWDGKGVASAWSPGARWTMGLLAASDWRAAWISDPELLRWQRSRLGFHSEITRDPKAPKWLMLDLGEARPIDEVRIQAVRYAVAEGLGFPVRFTLEGASNPSFSDAFVLLDRTKEDVPYWITSHRARADGRKARFLRLTPTLLRTEDDGTCRLAISQIEISSGGANIASQATVSASDSIETEKWSLRAVVDGLGSPRANPRANGTLLLRRSIVVKPGLKRALVFACGLGHYTLAVNGTKQGEDYLSPGWTQYDKRCLYDTHDVAPSLVEGENALGFTLAGGMYNIQSTGRYTKLTTLYRPLTLLALIRLEYADGSVETTGTDNTWRLSPGPTTLSSMFGGEDYDARLEPSGWSRPGFDDSTWTRAATCEGPRGLLSGSSQSAPPLRISEVRKVVSTQTFSPSRTVIDFGQNASMIIRLRAKGPRGAKIKLVPSELINGKGEIDRSSCGVNEASWNYTFAGTGSVEAWTPQFFYHGLRYLQVDLSAPEAQALPEVEAIEGLVLHSSSAPAGDFSCSSELMNRIRLLVRWAQRSNAMHIFTDCPHRERLGWIEQNYLNGPALRYEFNFARLFAKALNDMGDCQTEEGLITGINPEYVIFMQGFRDSPEWGAAFILSAWQQLVWTGHDSSLRRHYPAMRRYVDYLGTKATGCILSHGLGDWFDLGPERPGNAQLTPRDLTATAAYFASTDTLSRIAAHLGDTETSAKLSSLASQIQGAFNARFLDTAASSYSTGSQTANSLPLALGLVPPKHRAKVLQHVIDDIRSRGNAVTSGDIGYRTLLRALAEGGRSDVIFEMNNQSEKPGYGFQLARGCTALAESWQADRGKSHNHFMLGQITEWFYGDLAGIAPDPASPGWKRILMHPNPVPGITWAKASHQSPYGPVSISWEKKGSRFLLEAVVPANARAEIRIPCKKGSVLSESGIPLSKAEGLRILQTEPESSIIEVGSGIYHFEASYVE